MTDVLRNQPLRVLVGPRGGALLDLPYAQLDQVRGLFDRDGVNYWWSEVIVPYLGTEHSVTSLILSNNESPARVQSLLDAAT